MAEDYYKTLGVGKTASQEEIQKAYLKLARKYHPDMNPDDQENAKKKFQELQKAFETLKDPEKRKKYDQFGEGFENFSGFNGGANPFGAGGFQWSSSGGGNFSSNINIEDIFKAFSGGASGGNPFGGFGGGNPFGGAAQGRGGRSRRRPPSPEKGDDATSSLSIPFKTAILGGTVPISLRDSKTGAVKSVDVKIPAGLESGKKIKLRGMGDPGRNGGANGDLIITVAVESHPFYSRDGRNLHVRVPISLKEAAFGAKVDVPTPYGTVTLTIPPGSTSGSKLRVKGFGVRNGKKTEDGDLYAVCEIQTPKSWSKEDLELLEKIKASTPELRERFEF